jgi:hypothetical protein
MENRRRQMRKRLVSLTVVLDAKSGEVMGRVANLTTDGLMLSSDRALAIDRSYSLQIQLPDEVAGRTQIELEARSLWSQRAVDPTYYATGFEILNLSDSDRHVIEVLIQDAVFQRWVS